MEIRTIDQAWQTLKENDPETAISKVALRRLVISGEIPSRKVGVKYLIDLQDVRNYFSGRAS